MLSSSVSPLQSFANMFRSMKFITAGVVLLLMVPSFVESIQWPVPYRRFKSRPTANPYCQAGIIPFCPTGLPAKSMPTFQASDPIEVFALKAPVWEFKFGDLLAKFHIIHDAVGFRNVRTGINYTMEWYELFQLFNCTFPHLIKTETGRELRWCNQGAACIYQGIDDKHWAQNGTLVKVADMTGDQFNKFAQWALWDNETGIFYETWTVEQSPGGKVWFNPYDCASFVLRAFQQMGSLGAKFNHSVHLNYTKIHLYSDEPQYLGNASVVFGPHANQSLVEDIFNFYTLFQSHQDPMALLTSMIYAYMDVVDSRKFYLFYNFEYWFLPMHKPFLKLTYDEVPLP